MQASMQVFKYASMQVCKYEYASMQVCKFASLQECKYASIRVISLAVIVKRLILWNQNRTLKVFKVQMYNTPQWVEKVGLNLTSAKVEFEAELGKLILITQLKTRFCV